MPPPKQRGSQVPSEFHLQNDTQQDTLSFRNSQSRIEQNPFRFLPQKSQESLEARMRARYGASLRGRSTTHSFLDPHPVSWVSQQGQPFHTSLAPARTYNSFPGSQRRLVDKSDIHYPDAVLRSGQQYDQQHTTQHYVPQGQVKSHSQMYNQQYLQQRQSVTPLQDNLIPQSSSQFTLAASEVHDPVLVEQPLPFANDIDNWVRPRPPVFPHLRKRLEAQSSLEDGNSRLDQVPADFHSHSLSTISDQHSRVSASPTTRSVDAQVRGNSVEHHGLFNTKFNKDEDAQKDNRHEASFEQKDDSSKKQNVSTPQKEGKPRQKRKSPAAKKITKSRKQIKIKLTNKASIPKANEASKETAQSGDLLVQDCNCSCEPNKCESNPSAKANDLAGSIRKGQTNISGKIKYTSLATDAMVLRMDISELIDLTLRRGDTAMLPQLSLDVFAKIISPNDKLWEQIEPLMDGLKEDVDR